MYQGFNPYFTGLSILILSNKVDMLCNNVSFNPYFTGLSILIYIEYIRKYIRKWFQSLFYWIIYSYIMLRSRIENYVDMVSILILLDYLFLLSFEDTTGRTVAVSILILLDYLFLWGGYFFLFLINYCFNPYFTGLSILMRYILLLDLNW